jgi:CRISPR-associated protein Csm5
MADYAIHDVTVSLLTPLHIGTGRDLLHEYDYAIRAGRTWRINEDALLDAQDVDDPELARQLAQIKPAELLKPADYRPDSGYFRYVLQGTPRSNAVGAQLKEQIKDPYDQPYLPGSSLKGALRTAVAWHAWGERKLQPETRQLGRSKKWAGQDYEHQLLGKNPNHDLLRALHVSDSKPLTADQLMVINVRVLNRGGKMDGAPVEMEAIRPDTAFRLTLKLDLALFSEWARKGGLNLSGRAWLEHLGTVVGGHSQDLARREAAWFDQMSGTGQLAGFYKQLAGFHSSDRRFLVSLGWGTGWTDKTFGSRLLGDERFMERIIDDYRMTRGSRRAGDPFPKSRRAVVAVQKSRDGRIQETPVSPLGWCLVEMKERK